MQTRKDMLRRVLSKIKGFCKRKEIAQNPLCLVELMKQKKNAETLLHVFDCLMYDKAMELDEKRKQDYIE